jgi:hypothetical protein
MGSVKNAALSECGLKFLEVFQLYLIDPDFEPADKGGVFVIEQLKTVPVWYIWLIAVHVRMMMNLPNTKIAAMFHQTKSLFTVLLNLIVCQR